MPYFLKEIRQGYKIVVINTDLVVDKIGDNANITIVNGRLIVKDGSLGLGKDVSLSFLEKDLMLPNGEKPIAWAGYKGCHLSSYSPFQPIVEKNLPEHYEFLYGRNWNAAVQAECKRWCQSHPEPMQLQDNMMAAWDMARDAARKNPGQSISITVQSEKYDQPILMNEVFPEDNLIPSGETGKLFFSVTAKSVELDQNKQPQVVNKPNESSWSRYSLFAVTAAVAVVATGCAVYNQMTNK